MVRVILRGCSGRMGRVISGLLAEDREARLVAGVDLVDDGHNPYPVYRNVRECDVEADCLIDFSSAADWDDMLDYCVEKKLPCVLCTTGLSDAQLEKIEKASESIAVLRSANMSMGINLLLKLLKNAASRLIGGVRPGSRRFRYGGRGAPSQSKAGCTQRHGAGAGRLSE